MEFDLFQPYFAYVLCHDIMRFVNCPRKDHIISYKLVAFSFKNLKYSAIRGRSEGDNDGGEGEVQESTG